METIETATIPEFIDGVRILFDNTQTIDLPLVGSVGDVAPSFGELASLFSEQTWVLFAGPNISVQSSKVILFNMIKIPTTPAPEAPNDAPAEILPVG